MKKQSPSPLPKQSDEGLQQLRQDLSRVSAASPAQYSSMMQRSPVPHRRSLSTSTPLGDSYHAAAASFPPRGLLAPIKESPSRLLSISPADDVEVQRHSLVEWMKGYSVELTSHQSSIVAAELLMFQIMEGTKELHQPNPLRTAAICCAAEQLTESMPRYATVLRPVLKELFEAIYEPVGATPSQEFVAASLAKLGIGTSEGVRLQKFLARKPFFESLRENEIETARIEQRMHEVSARQGKGHATFSNAISNWQSSYLRCVFVSWRAVVSSGRKNRYLLNGFFRHVNRRDTLQTHFFAWRAFTKDAKLEQLRNQYKEGIDQVVQQEAFSNARYLEADDAREELRLTCIRLKEEEEKLQLQCTQLENLSESSIAAAEGWRSVTIDVVNFMASIRKIISSSHKVSGASHFNKAYELAVRVVLGWAGSIVSHLPQANKLRMGNFLVDVRDGVLLILVLHVVTNGDVSLAVLDRKDIPSRMQVVLDALNTLDIQLFLTLEHLIVSPSADVFFLIFYSIWERFALPPLADGTVCVGYSNGFRNDLTQTRDYLDLMKAFYPSWFEQRNILQHYALYIAAGRSQAGGSTSASVAANEETRIRQELQAQYTITNSFLVPAVFLCSVTLNPTQRFQNDEELLRVNEVIGKHVALVDAMFNFYSYSRNVMSTTVKQRSVASKKTLEVEHTVTGSIREMDAFSFYRFCADCGILKSFEESQASAATAAAASKKKVVRNPGQQQTDVKAKEPIRFSKLQCYEMFSEVVSKFRNNSTSTTAGQLGAGGGAALSLNSPNSPQSPSPSSDVDLASSILASPVAFSALLLHLAVHRYGQPVLPSSMQPAPGSVVLESLINTDVGPRAGAVQELPFLRDLFTEEPQAFLAPWRTLLRKFFVMHASLHNKNAMTLQDWTNAMINVLVTSNSSSSALDDSKNNVPSSALASDAETTLMLQKIFLHVSEMYVKTLGGAEDVPPVSEASPKRLPPTASGVDPAAPGVSANFFVYGEFEVALAAVAVERCPSPFVSIRCKLLEFFAQCESAMNEIVFAPPTSDGASVARGARAPTESGFSSTMSTKSL